MAYYGIRAGTHSERFFGGALFFFSTSSSDFEGVREDVRYYTDMTEVRLYQLIDHDCRIIKLWNTDDVRPDGNDKWLNVLLEKTH